ncbi:MAG: Cell division inhibitor [Nitrospira sp.]|nr:MAG: Cell division inhibitor [Nitrospira sp.]
MAEYPLTVWFDGACPLCSREMTFMKRLDRKRRLRFCDFSAPGSDIVTSEIPVSELSAVIHAQWGDGTVIRGVEVFRAIWQAVGLGFLTRMSRLPLIDPLAVKAYAWFARNRLWLTGRKVCTSDQCRNQ